MNNYNDAQNYTDNLNNALKIQEKKLNEAKRNFYIASGLCVFLLILKVKR